MTDERPWDEARIAELRRLATAYEQAEAAREEAYEYPAIAHAREAFLRADDAFNYALTPPVVLSLLNELERERQRRECAKNAFLRAVEARDAATAELERVRRERDEAREGLTAAYMVGYERGQEVGGRFPLEPYL